jgi:hypothetical protein
MATGEAIPKNFSYQKNGLPNASPIFAATQGTRCSAGGSWAVAVAEAWDGGT